MRNLHKVRIATDDTGFIAGVYIDDIFVKGCTGLRVEANAKQGYLNVVLSMEVDSVEGLNAKVDFKQTP